MQYSSSNSPSPMSIWQRLANLLALASFLSSGILLAWVEGQVWQYILAHPEDPVGLNPVGMWAALIGPLLWVFFAGVLATFTGQPPGRWVAFGWGILTLASAGPLIWYYRQMAEPAEPTHAHRQLAVAVELTITILIASLLPRPFRSGLGVGLVLSFVILPSLAGLIAAVSSRSGNALALLGWHLPDPVEIFSCSLEYALFSGIGLGLFLGVGICFGWVKVETDPKSTRSNHLTTQQE